MTANPIGPTIPIPDLPRRHDQAPGATRRMGALGHSATLQPSDSVGALRIWSRTLAVIIYPATSRYRVRRSALSLVMGTRALGGAVGQVAVFEGVGVAECCCDRESEEVADTSDVPAGGVDFLENAVLPQSLWFQLGCDSGKVAADWCSSRCGLPVDEEVRVEGRGPGLRPVVEVGGQAGQDGSSQ